MTIRLLGLVPFIFFTFVGLHASEWLPKHSANTWTYQTTWDQSTRDVTINGFDGNWTRFSDFAGFGQAWIWSHADSNNLYVWDEQNGTYQKLVNTTDPIGTEYNFTLVSGAELVRIAARGTELVGGVSYETLTLAFASSSPRGPFISEVTLAKGIGVLKWLYINPVDGLSTYILQNATVNGLNIAQENTNDGEMPLQLRASFDKTIVGPAVNEVHELTATLELVNESAIKRFIEFETSQHFDLVLLDENMNQIRKWSERIRFQAGVHSVEIGAGETFSETLTITLADAEQNGLAPGRYYVRVEVTGRFERYMVIVPLQVVHI